MILDNRTAVLAIFPQSSKEQSRQYCMILWCHDSLCASDEQGDSTQDHLRAHALHCSPNSQIQLSWEGEPWGGPQVTQGLQTLESKNKHISVYRETRSLSENQLNG